MPFDKALNHPLLPIIEPSVPPKVNAKFYPFGGTPEARRSLTRVSVSLSLPPCVSLSLTLYYKLIVLLGRQIIPAKLVLVGAPNLFPAKFNAPAKFVFFFPAKLVFGIQLPV